MSYSRRQLYALGEPLGDSVTRKEGGRIIYGDGGGGGGSPAPAPAPQTSTTYTSSLPEYAKPYFERGMERTEALSQEGYIPYTGQRIEDYSPQQQALFQQTYGLGRPSELTGASQATGAATLGALGTQYGPGQFNPAERFGIAQMQEYMSPYQQGVTDIAKRQAALDAMKIQQASNLGAARTGTYGGARQLLAQTEREKALGTQLSDIQTKGLQSAFENAQAQFERDQARRFETQKAEEQSRQFGANLGLQGLQTALTGAGQLAQIGKDTQATDIARLQAQQAVAGAEQSQRQKALDMAYQDFLAQREFPYRQLEFYNAMLRGLPVKADTTSSSYQAQPNVAQQVLGYGIPALALSKAFSAS
jgi:hypothetical protein